MADVVPETLEREGNEPTCDTVYHRSKSQSLSSKTGGEEICGKHPKHRGNANRKCGSKRANGDDEENWSNGSPTPRRSMKTATGEEEGHHFGNHRHGHAYVKIWGQT